MIVLNKREIPAVTFRHVLPAWLGPMGSPDYKGKPVECYIEINARAGGAVNPDFQAGVEEVRFQRAVDDRSLARITDDAEYIRGKAEREVRNGGLWIAAIYDACVIDWKTNIQSEGKDIEPTRDAFIALCDVKVDAIALAVAKFQAAVMRAGIDVQGVEDDTVKN